MKYKTGKCIECNAKYLTVDFIRSRKYSFCCEKHAATYIIKGMVKSQQ